MIYRIQVEEITDLMTKKIPMASAVRKEGSFVYLQ